MLLALLFPFFSEWAECPGKRKKKKRNFKNEDEVCDILFFNKFWAKLDLVVFVAVIIFT